VPATACRRLRGGKPPVDRLAGSPGRDSSVHFARCMFIVERIWVKKSAVVRALTSTLSELHGRELAAIFKDKSAACLGACYISIEPRRTCAPHSSRPSSRRRTSRSMCQKRLVGPDPDPGSAALALFASVAEDAGGCRRARGLPPAIWRPSGCPIAPRTWSGSARRGRPRHHLIMWTSWSLEIRTVFLIARRPRIGRLGRLFPATSNPRTRRGVGIRLPLMAASECCGCDDLRDGC